MSDQPVKSKRLFDDPEDGHDVFAAVTQGNARLGEVLAETRAVHGLELADVSRNLLIREEYLSAIEKSDFDRLPGPTYAVGFVRSYADFLGLDGKAAVKLFKSEREGMKAQTTLSFPEPVAESRIPRGAILFVSIVLVIFAYGAWYYLSSHDVGLGDLVPEVPTTMDGAVPSTSNASGAPVSGSTPDPSSAANTAAPAEAEPLSSTSGTEAGAPAGAAVPAPAPAPEPAPARDATPLASAASPPAAVPSTAMPPAVSSEPPMPDAGAPPRPLSAPDPSLTPETASSAIAPQSAAARAVIEIRAKADSWVQIRGPDGRVVVMRIFRAGDSFRVPDEDGLTLMTGNAGGIEIVVDGTVVPAIGPFGAVRRNVALDPERLRAGSSTAR
jgi:cytoskeleton protein RodZ